MMYWTLDTLLIDDPSSGEDKTQEWEDRCDQRNSPRIKFPLKMMDEKVGDIDVNFTDPVLKDPKPKTKGKKNPPKVVDLNKKKNKDKNKLF